MNLSFPGIITMTNAFYDVDCEWTIKATGYKDVLFTVVVQ